MVRNTERLLEILAGHNVKATFFILGEVAKKFPYLIRKIASNGHEIGVHGSYHRQVFKLTKEQFRHEVADCKKLVEDITSVHVLGHRAPAFSIMPETKWALEVLRQEGFQYDSSVFPITGRRYGWPGFSRDICKIALPHGQSIIEVPLSTVTILGKRLPIAGGGYTRLLPYVVTKWAMGHIQKERPVIVYMHPYEIDSEPKPLSTNHLELKDKNRAIRRYKRQLRNRNTVGEKLNKLLSDFDFSPLKEVIRESLKITLE